MGNEFKVAFKLWWNPTGPEEYQIPTLSTNAITVECSHADGTAFGSDKVVVPDGSGPYRITVTLQRHNGDSEKVSADLGDILGTLMDMQAQGAATSFANMVGYLVANKEGLVILHGELPIPAATGAAASAGTTPAIAPAGTPTPAQATGTAVAPAPAPAVPYHVLPDPIAERSGLVPVSAYDPGKSITLNRTTRSLTGDLALWLLIKLNSEMLGWDNYIRQIDRLFFPGKPDTPETAPLYGGASHLSRRRFLPFTDTDAYRALKVATEAFVVTWGAVVPNPSDWNNITNLLSTDPAALALVKERLGLTLQPGDPTLAQQYFGKDLPPTLPYLQRVVLAMQGTDAAGALQDALQAEANAITLRAQTPPPATPAPNCGDGCLWLRHWNDNISAKLASPPLIELIWSYWMEELQLVQTMNAISRRFQNVSVGQRDPLAQLELDPLRPLNNMIWGWVQDEQHRLPIERRAAEYLHEYGFRLIGKAVPPMQAADTRSKFLAAFHTLLNLCVPFFRQADDTTVVPDGFPLLNALREVHLILSEGAHNQFRDLPTTSRVEMMMQQWLLARPEFREFLPRRSMVAYPEPWMHSVESMRKLQGWGDTNTYQFWQLATTGEQIVASIRWSDWNSVTDPVNAANWAAFFRPEIQTYIHSYRAVTGIDVSAEPVDVQVPGLHLLRRLREQRGTQVA